MSETSQSGALGSETATPRYCFACGSAIEDGARNCPACRQLIHADDLGQIAAQARALESTGDIAEAAMLWGKALELLPADSEQAASIRDHRTALGAQSRIAAAQSNGSSGPSADSAAPGTEQKTDWKKRLGPVGVIVAFFAKFKFLLYGLFKLNTLLTMFASMGLYWALYGWKFGVGFVLGIYVHEMGHVWSLKHFGLRASAPMFIPGFGALVSLYDSPANHSDDARIGLAGPIWGTGAALACLLPWVLNGGGIWLALAHSLAFINLFNLIPIWQLDGGRGFRALDRQQRLLSMGLMLALWYFSHANLFLALAAGGAYRVFWAKDQPTDGDGGAFVQYAGLLLMLGAMLAWIK